MVIKALSSSQDSLNTLSQFPTNEQSLSLLVESLFCNDPLICCENTKYISMKILTNYFEKNFSQSIYDQLVNYYIINFKSDNYNSSLTSSQFSVDLFATLFKQDSQNASHILNDFFSIGVDRFDIVILYTVRYVRKRQITAGFENILLNIFQNMPRMIQTFNEMLSITPIARLLIPVIVSQKIHLDLFKYSCANQYVCKALNDLLQLGFLFSSPQIFDSFVFDYIRIFDEIITDVQQLEWKSDLLINLRRTDSFRKLPFDSFFINLIQKVLALLEFSFENFDQSIEIISKLLSFFGELDQLNCNSHFEGALSFSHDIMKKCQFLILNSVSKIQYNGINDLNSPISNFFEKCASLLVFDYINSISNLLDIHSLASFEIIKEMILKHENNSSQLTQFAEIDKNCLISFFSLENKPIEFIVDYLGSFVKIYRPISFFIEEYFQALIILIQNLQSIQNIDLKVLRSAVDYIDQIPIIDENQLSFLISNPLFPFINQKEHRKEMKRIFQKISNLYFIDKIIGNILSIQNLNPEIILDYFKEIPLILLFDLLFPVIQNEFISKIDPVIIVNYIYSIIKRMKNTYFPIMCDQIISYVKLLCEIMNDISINNFENFHIQKKIMKSLTVIYQFSSLNIGILFFYKDFFLTDLILKNIEFLNSIDIQIISDAGSRFILNYFRVFFENLDFLSDFLLNDDAVCLFLKTSLLQIQQNDFDFDFLNNLFNVFYKFIEYNKISNPIKGLTDILIEECLKKVSTGKLPYSMFLSISYLFKLHSELFASIIQFIISQEKSENIIMENMASTIVNGTNDEIINASQFFFNLFTSNINSFTNFQKI